MYSQLFRRKKTVLTSLFLFIFTLQVYSQQNVTLSGYVKDASNGETLIGATVYIEESQKGTVSNPYGFYSLSLPEGTYQITYSYIGYQKITKTVDLTANVTLDIELQEEGNQLEEVVVEAEASDANVTSVEMSTNKLEMSTIQKMPALLGEVDVIRSIQLLPGVSSIGEGATGFNVRGGDISQNLVLLDEAPVYNSSHLFGFFSVFNPDAVKDVKLVKGGIPAQYGGRLSSLLDIRMKEGNSKRFSASGGVGTIFSRLALEGPIVKDKSSFIIAGRRSYADVLAAPFLGGDFANSDLYFYDLTVKANYNFSDKDRIYLSGYFGRDKFGVPDNFGFSWGNATGSFRWNHLFNSRLFSNLTVFYSDYDYSLSFGAEEDAFDWNAGILNYSVKPEFTYYPNSDNMITFGGQATYYRFEPGKTGFTSLGESFAIDLDDQFALEAAIYVGNEQKLNDQISLQYGLRLSYFGYYGDGNAYEYGEPERIGGRRPLLSRTPFEAGELIEDYSFLEPRFSMKYQVGRRSSIKASYNRMAQYIHLASNTNAASPLDIWLPSTNNVEPQRADQFAIGYFQNSKNDAYEGSVEVFYKDFLNQVEFIDGSDLLLNELIEGDILTGIGRAYGAEFYLKKISGKLHGWISYTVARTERKVEGINNGAWFPARFDQTHNLSLVGFYDLNDRWSFSTNFTYITGTPATFPTNRYEFQGYTLAHNVGGGRNNNRIADYHRLDLSATLQGKKMKKGKERKNEDYWVFSLYNVYGRRNPYSVYFQPNEMGSRPDAIRLSIIGSIVPSISYNFKF